ncbi:coenzyme F420-0:L-glutamate ligase [Vaginisenegalia massiliensis]|uniref:coenzyme F420-0:L-glutamate ligase n=1 Tax=Vaginisenegalia massiliensis TaxID=2058294 RepID=UPI000F53C371|nr:coenzyme F420-0:L-glutamate ligase [Vaginisenegalia massiliensis]
MERLIGTVARGLRAPIFKQGDNLVQLIPDLLDQVYQQEDIKIGQKDVLAITESVVARTQGNYVTIDQVAEDLNRDFAGQTLGVIFPILSRNRFAIILRAIARSQAKKIILQLSFPADEVGNHLISLEQMDAAGLDPWTDVMDEAQYRKLFGQQNHEFTGIDYVAYYKEIVEAEGKECEVIFANSPFTILQHTDYVINCDIHTRQRTKNLLLKRGAKCVRSLDDIMNQSIDGSGYNPQYGLLGSNKATEESIKLFPRDCQELVEAIQVEVARRTGKTIEVMVYGDGAFKDPVGKIWELADPVVSPGYTSGLEGTPNELKLKYLADNDFKDLSGQALKQAIQQAIQDKEADLVGQMATQGTTPRQLTDLLGSLCDLVSGSGDKGTPIIYIQGYFDNYTN